METILPSLTWVIIDVLTTILFFLNLCVQKCFACMHICATCTCLVPPEPGRERWIPWKWN